ncbi:MAG: endonuclease [Mollicutes bacterium]|nr:endonuclease [Mollicutes bacterium]
MKNKNLLPLSVLLSFSLAACGEKIPYVSLDSNPISESATETPTEKPSSSASSTATGSLSESPSLSEKPSESPSSDKTSVSVSASASEKVKNDGSKQHPYSCKEAKEKVNGLADKEVTAESYYVFGSITKIEEVSTSYGNATFTISSDDVDLVVFRGYYLNQAKFTSSNQIKIGDDVVVYGTLQRYNGIFETGSKAYLSSVNRQPGETPTEPSTPSENPSTPSENPSTSIQPSPDAEAYYSSLGSNLTGGANGTLRTALTSLIKPKGYYTYSGKGTGKLSEVLQSADEDPNNPSNRIYFYTQASVKKNPAETWNREHVWPQSLSANLYGTTGGGQDLLHIRPTYPDTNSKRSNDKFGDCTGGNTVNYNGTVYGTQKNGYFEPVDAVKGDVARICFYRWTCYFAERGTPLTNVCDSVATLKKWNKLDPVSQIEINRNDFAQSSKQKNRNPFVDHPEWVDQIF